MHFLHAFFHNLSIMSFLKFVSMTKNTLFFPILHIFAPLNDIRGTRVHCLVLKNNPNYVNFFYEDDIQLQIQVLPPPAFYDRNFLSHITYTRSLHWPYWITKHGCLKWLFIDFFSKMSHFISQKSWKLVANNQIY